MRRLAGALVLVLALAGCRDDGSGGSGGSGPGVDQQVSDLESTVASVESEMAGD